MRKLPLLLIVFAIVAPAAAFASNPAQVARDRATVWRVSVAVFGARAPAAFCIASWETGHTWSPSAGYPNGGNWGEWQINRSTWDPALNPRSPFSGGTWSRVLGIWTNARMAFHISRGGTDWHDWSTHRLCGL